MVTLDGVGRCESTQRSLKRSNRATCKIVGFYPEWRESIQKALQRSPIGSCRDFRTQGIDGRINRNLGNRQSLSKSRTKRENGGIIFEDVTI